MKHLGIDIGTGSVKLMIVEPPQAERLASAGYAVSSPEPGFAETDPAFWLSAVKDCVASLGDLTDLASIGLSGQMHGIVPCSLKTGALYPAILWFDQRGKAVLPRLEALGSQVRRRVGNSWASGMAIATILWIKQYQKKLYNDTDVFLPAKDYLRWVLTGQVATDLSDASGTLLCDLERQTWAEGLLKELDIDSNKLPPLLRSDQVAGYVTAGGSSQTGLPLGLPVATGGADTAAALYGSGLEDEQTIQIGIGSGAQVVRLRRQIPRFNPRLNLFAGVQSGLWYQMAAMLNGGLALEWVKNLVGLDWNGFYAQIGQDQPPLDLHFLPYLSGERTPWLNPNARGCWVGLCLRHQKTDLLHAALLGVACTVRLGLETIGTVKGQRYCLVGGSAKYPYWNQVLANVLKVSLTVSLAGDASARGAARLGAQAINRPFAVNDQSLLYQPQSLPGIDDYFQTFKTIYRRLYG